MLLAGILCTASFAQVNVRFEMRNGTTYAVISNNGAYAVPVAWRCVNYQTGEYKDGAINLQGGYETLIGPNVGWIWQVGEQLIYQVGNSQKSISFKGSSPKIKKSCHIRSHDCPYGIDRNNDGWCDNCMKNGYRCHMADHNP